MCLQTGAKPLAARTKRTAPEEGVPLPILRTRENMETVPQSDRQPQGRQSTAGAQRKSPPGHATLRLSLEEALMKSPFPKYVSPTALGRNMPTLLKTQPGFGEGSSGTTPGNATNVIYGTDQNHPCKLLPGVLCNVILPV